MNTLHSSWERAWRVVGAGRDDGLRDRLLAAYAEPHRAYHTLQHLAECVGALAPVLGLAERPGEVEAALWFHDAVYEIGRADNEERSADWAGDALRSAGVTSEVAGRVRALVLATRHTEPPWAADEVLLVDVDLSVLGAPPSRFAEYEAQVRQEYAAVPEEMFRRKRREVLQGFLDRPTIYGTSHFRNTLETVARENLRLSVAALAGP